MLNQLTHEYQQSKSERHQIATSETVSESEEFTILEEMERLTVEIRGYANQIQAQGSIESVSNAVKQLRQCQVFDRRAIAEFYFNPQDDYPQTKAYLRTLDYLRLVIPDCLLPIV